MQRVDGEQATVRSRPLLWDGAAFVTGPVREELVRWSTGGMSLLDGLSAGQRVSLHWDWVCDVVTEEQVTLIESLEIRQRASLSDISLSSAIPAAR